LASRPTRGTVIHPPDGRGLFDQQSCRCVIGHDGWHGGRIHKNGVVDANLYPPASPLKPFPAGLNPIGPCRTRQCLVLGLSPCAPHTDLISQAVFSLSSECTFAPPVRPNPTDWTEDQNPKSYRISCILVQAAPDSSYFDTGIRWIYPIPVYPPRESCRDRTA